MKTYEIDIDEWTAASPEVVFGILADGARWPEWSELGSATIDRKGTLEADGVGAIRRFTTGRIVSVEEVVAFDRPTTFAYELRDGLPLKGYRAQVDLTARDGGTVIHWRSTFQAKVPLTGGLFHRKLEPFIRRLVADLSAHAAAVGSGDGTTATTVAG